jgi:LacI family transcriptional regulator
VRRLGPFAPKTQSGATADAAVHSGVTACIAYNDLIAIGMLQRLRERRIRVPEDMSIVGCDDIFGADFWNPPLTSMASPIEQAGRVAVSMLLAQLNPRGAGGTRNRSLCRRISRSGAPLERRRLQITNTMGRRAA